MRRILTILLTTVALGAVSQQATQYSQYMFNPFAINPALAGRKPCVDIRMGYKLQWVGVDGAPKFGYLNVNGRLKSESGNYLSPYHGLGGQIERDDIGPFGQTRIAFIYAITVPFNRTLKMSMGVAAGVRQFSFGVADARTIDPDPSIQGSAQQFMIPDGNIGVFLEDQKYFIGFNIDNLFANRWKDFGYESRLRPQFILMGGYKLNLNENFDLLTSMMLKIGKRVPPALDLNAVMEYKGWFAFGLGYRNVDAVMALLRFRFFQRFSLGYSFDFITSRLGPGSKHSHELSLGFTTCKPAPRKGATNCADFQ